MLQPAVGCRDVAHIDRALSWVDWGIAGVGSV